MWVSEQGTESHYNVGSKRRKKMSKAASFEVQCLCTVSVLSIRVSRCHRVEREERADDKA